MFHSHAEMDFKELVHFYYLQKSLKVHFMLWNGTETCTYGSPTYDWILGEKMLFIEDFLFLVSPYASFCKIVSLPMI
jgi:hypothetical protein